MTFDDLIDLIDVIRNRFATRSRTMNRNVRITDCPGSIERREVWT